MDEATVERYARELQRRMVADPLVLHLDARVTAEELDYIIFAYVREKIDGRSFIYTDILRAFVADFIERKGFTMIEDNVCREMPVFRRKPSDDDSDNDDWVGKVIVS